MNLTIAIPTYDRCSDLKVLLESIAIDIHDCKCQDVEVLVVDNASPDETEQVVDGFRSRIQNIRYLRNETNIGMQANFVRALTESAGHYTWMIGDDEVLEEGGLHHVLDAIKGHPTPMFILNYSSEPAPFGECFLKQVFDKPLSSGVFNIKDFVYEKGWLWTLGNLGMVIVESSRIRDVDPTPHMASCFVQAGWYFEALYAESLTFLDKAVFRTRTVSQTKNKERWLTDGTAGSFHAIVQSLERFTDVGIIGDHVPVTFLNACSCNRLPIWNYFLQNVLTAVNRGNFYVDECEWRTMTSLISRLDDDTLRISMQTYLDVLRNAILAVRSSHQNAIWLINRLHPNLFYGTV